MGFGFWTKALAAVAAVWAVAPLAAAAGGRVEFPYSGRLVTHEGFPLAGPVDLELSFWGSSAGREDLTSREPLTFKAVPLLNGVFTVLVAMDDDEASVVFGSTGSAWVELKDLTNNRTYKRVRVARPLAAAVATVPPPPVAEPSAAAPAAASAPSTSSPFAPELVRTAAAACLASQVAGAKFVTGASQDVACNAACGNTRAGSACLRGWTAYEGGASFDFGNECAVAEMAGAVRPVGRLCCCLTGGGPTPIIGEDLRGVVSDVAPISH